MVIAASIALSGCGASKDDDAASTAPASSAAPEASETPEESESPEETTAPPAAAGDVAAPGSKVSLGESQSYPFVTGGTGTEKAVISVKLVSADAASAEQTAFLVEQIPQLKGYKVTLLRLEQTKVSGDTIAFDADYTSFDPVDTEGAKGQLVSVIGWDDCTTNSFSEEFDTAGAVLAQCVVGASVEGGNEIAGVMWDGGWAEPNPYDEYDGKPLLFMK